jgi:hypothetical protein
MQGKACLVPTCAEASYTEHSKANYFGRAICISPREKVRYSGLLDFWR